MYRRNGRAHARRTTIALVAAAAAAFSAAITLGGAGAAVAAEYDHPAAIDPASITVATVDGDESLAQFDQVRVDADWSVPDDALGGQTFGFTLPSQFARSGLTFSVPSTEDPSKIVAECAVSSDTAPVVTCTLTDYVNGRTGVNGSLWFLASADEQTSETTLEFVVDGKSTRVETPGGGITPLAPLPSEPQKVSWQTDDGNIAWQIELPGASFPGVESIIVDDALTPPDGEVSEHHNEDGQLVVWSTDVNQEDYRTITNWTGGWNEEGTAFHLEIPGAIDPARTYLVKYLTVPSSQADGTSFSNVANVNGVVVQDREVWQVTGGGTGDGTATGAFTLTKAVDGSGASDVPADAEYTVRYSYGDPAVEKTVAVTAGVATAPVHLPSGTVVTLEELTPPAVEGIEWSTPVFSGTGVRETADGGAQITVYGGSTLAITLTNTATSKPPVVPPTAPPTPETPVTPPADVTPPTELPLTGDSLATTGGGVPTGMLWSAGAALLLGIALTTLAAARARRRMNRA
ncbi:MAG: hypothetical protein K0Q52_791 [Microbacterium sp.]|nr:hypothetical protein [Microbacterium sp.]